MLIKIKQVHLILSCMCTNKGKGEKGGEREPKKIDRADSRYGKRKAWEMERSG